jgi:hypothetical protein
MVLVPSVVLLTFSLRAMGHEETRGPFFCNEYFVIRCRLISETLVVSG